MIIASAAKLDRKFPIIVTGKTHKEIVEKLVGFNLDTSIAEYGFYTDDNRFISAREAVYHARACGQVSLDFDKRYLSSSDILIED